MRRALRERAGIGLLGVRPEGPFAGGHPLFAASCRPGTREEIAGERMRQHTAVVTRQPRVLAALALKAAPSRRHRARGPAAGSAPGEMLEKGQDARNPRMHVITGPGRSGDYPDNNQDSHDPARHFRQHAFPSAQRCRCLDAPPFRWDAQQ